MEVAAGVAESRELHLSSGRDMDMVQWTLASAAANGMNVMRMFAHGVRPDFPLQISPGEHIAHSLESETAPFPVSVTRVCCCKFQFGKVSRVC